MHAFWRASYTFCLLVCDILFVILGRSGEHGAPVSPKALFRLSTFIRLIAGLTAQIGRDWSSDVCSSDLSFRRSL